ncbi:acylamino-acid-releasing enzyme-like isoform X1 [Bombyx mandarina]|uniref:Prolyl endopeptidase n=1 Tax=Bombyx mandarina TaxID=7092 RepID=A0A6J2JFR6_BOMMA|nr:acylamino-acid-releasing enzyme-like isoform X1 [Bombyx mandarina]XP_028027897.1 acylamino-acid-releasing enzyme-like isoform X1 [Bombyx mandarina]
MSKEFENVIRLYKNFSKVPSIVGAHLSRDTSRVTVKWTVRSTDRGKNTRFVSSYILNDSLKVIADCGFGTDISNELLSAVSPNETYRAVIREERNQKDLKKQYLEVWSKNHLAHCIDLNALDLHGDVYADSEFGCLNWSQDESAIVYVAEKKLAKAEPYIVRKPAETPKSDSKETPRKGEEYIYRQDWGEQLVGKHASVIVVCKIESESFTVLDGLPEDWCPGQVRFTLDGKSVIGIAWSTEPRRLGLIFCTNRPGHVFTLSLEDDKALSRLSPEGMSVRAARLSPRGAPVWLQRVARGPHHAGHQLVTGNIAEAPLTVIVDLVQTVTRTDDGRDFHGIYSQSLPARCFSKDGKRIVFSTPQKNEIRSYVVDIESGGMVDVSIRRAAGSTSVLDVHDDVILAAHSSLTSPSQLYVARLPARGSEAEVEWMPVTSQPEVPAGLARSEVTYLQLEHADCADPVKSFSAIYLSPSVQGGSKLPLLVWPHGGPHSNFTNSYSFEAAFFNDLGFAILHVNYRGSTGAGEASVAFLPKRVGDADVKDCKLATETAVARFGLDESKLCLMGGSHGGFLVAHLSGQYPDLFKVVVSRNPVIDVASMFNSTDIADWCAVEAGFPFTEEGPPSEEQLLAMRRCSPLVHAHKVKAPTALMLGSADKRVPHYQGLEYARRLKANGVATRVYLYDDNHSLSSPLVEMDNLINAALWFLKHLDQ